MNRSRAWSLPAKANSRSSTCPTDRQQRLFRLVGLVLEHEFSFANKDQARDLFITLEEQLRNWNFAPDGSPAMAEAEARVRACLTPAPPPSRGEQGA